ncbi:MAG: putative sugar O-methyltransferase [Deltaproteobacteria bacterium]|nr:putative sugar O-methyltransferase [Deltaproteobacteria bacterium]
MTAANYQVRDNLPLLAEMMDARFKCDPLYQPTLYWTVGERTFVRELQHVGLKDFRRRKGSILSSFGAVDLAIKGNIRFEPPVQFRGLWRINRGLLRVTQIFEECYFTFNPNIVHDPEEITKYFYRMVKYKYENLGLDIQKCPVSLWGNPEDLIELGGTFWSLAHLQYCSMFIDAARHITFGSDMVFCELGSGLGRNVEVLAQLFPEATFFVFDIPPQLYVAHQYLSEVFGNRLIKYNEAVLLKPTSGRSMPDCVKGKIVLLPSWFMPVWSDVKMDIFWNSASFQEMEPNVVVNYLRLVKTINPRWIYINALPKGKDGTKIPISDNYYTESLGSQYNLLCTYETDYFLRSQGYLSYVFKSI